jgi:enoyl-CoA hydratase
MPQLTSYALDGDVATIAMDDGKVNALSVAMLDELGTAFDRAEADKALVVLTGREQTFSAGFDLRAEPDQWPNMVAGGAKLAARIMSFPRPVIVSCNGNAIAMAGFILLSADYRIGTIGEFQIGLNEVAIGLTVPWFGIEIARHRLTRPYFDRCTITGALLGPDAALAAGFFDDLVAPEQLRASTLDAVRALSAINRDAHAATKLRVREQALAGIRNGIERITSPGQEW